jgi:hypothetical protein
MRTASRFLRQIRNCWARDVWIYSMPTQTRPGTGALAHLIFETLPRVLWTRSAQYCRRDSAPRNRQSDIAHRARALELRTSGSFLFPKAAESSLISSVDQPLWIGCGKGKINSVWTSRGIKSGYASAAPRERRAKIIDIIITSFSERRKQAAATDVPPYQPPVFRATSESSHDRGSASATCILTGQDPCGHAS